MLRATHGADGGTGSARRRRERRLRSWLRHEHQSIAAVLARVTTTPSARWAPRVAFYGTRRQPPGPGRERSTRRTSRLRFGRLLSRKLQPPPDDGRRGW